MRTFEPMSDLNTISGLSDRLRIARERAGLSARALGRAAGLGTRTISLLESGARPDPRRSTIEAISKTLGVSLEWLLLGTGEPPKGGAS